MKKKSKHCKTKKKKPDFIECFLDILECQMAAIDDLKAAVSALQAEVIVIVNEISNLKANSNEADIAAAAQAINDEVAKLKAAE